MLIPRISLRILFIIIAVFSVMCVALAMAVRGQVWAIATSLTMFLCLKLFLCYTSSYLAASAVSQISRSFTGGGSRQSPFASNAVATRQGETVSPFAVAAPPAPATSDNGENQIVAAEIIQPEAPAADDDASSPTAE